MNNSVNSTNSSDFVNQPQPTARDLQEPGQELYRHDLTVFFMRHPCQLEVFQAQEEACSNDDERAELVYQTWQDLIPAYVKYSNRGPETCEDRKLRSLMSTSRYYRIGA